MGTSRTSGQAWSAVSGYTVRGMAEAIVISDPRIMMGKPVISGTRITVELILEKLAAGESVAQLVEAHPTLTEASIRAALAFAARALRADVVYPVHP
jgi:uncharacterized protein (DUF433 family)